MLPLPPSIAGPQCEQLGIAYTAFDIAAATLWQFTLGINLIRRSAAAAAAAAAAAEGHGTEPGTPSGALEGSPDAGLPVTARLHKHPTVSDLLQGRRGSRPGSVSSSPRNAPSPLPAAFDSPQPGRHQQQLGGSPLRASAGALLPPPSPYSSSSVQQGQHPDHMHVVELQPVPATAPAAAGWQQAHQRHASQGQQQERGWQQQQEERWRHGSRAASDIDEDDSAALLSGTGSKAGRGQRSTGGTSAAGGHNTGGWLARLAHSLRQVDWAAAFPLPSQAAILGELLAKPAK